jgi:hypothetical protein
VSDDQTMDRVYESEIAKLHQKVKFLENIQSGEKGEAIKAMDNLEQQLRDDIKTGDELIDEFQRTFQLKANRNSDLETSILFDSGSITEFQPILSIPKLNESPHPDEAPSGRNDPSSIDPAQQHFNLIIFKVTDDSENIASNFSLRLGCNPTRLLRQGKRCRNRVYIQ